MLLFKLSSKFRASLAFAVCLLALTAEAGSPASVTETGNPVTWGDNPIVTYHPESGTCASFTNNEMLANLDTYLSLWDQETDVSLSLSSDAGALPDIDGDNFETYIYSGSGTQTNLLTLTDGLNPIVFDDDGEITAEFVGAANAGNVLGFAGPTAFNDETGVVSDGQVVLNCRCIENHPIFEPCESGGVAFELSEETLWSTATHEFGHFLGLDHSQVNFDYYNNGSDSDDDHLPIMFPFSFSDQVPVVLTTDDVVSAAYAYPSSIFTNSHCRVTGTLLDINGDPLRCADVQARPADDGDTVSFVSGAMAIATDNNGDADTVDSGECESGCGDFELYLEPGVDYTIYATPIYSLFVGGSSLSPCVNEVVSTITEEPIAEITGADCTATFTRDLGEITTLSTAGTSGGSSGDDGGNGDDDDDSSSGGSGGGSVSGGDNPIGYWCSLHPEAKPGSGFAASLTFLLFLPLLFARLWQTKSR